MSVLELVREQEKLSSASEQPAEPRALALGETRSRLKSDLVERLGLSVVASMAANEDVDAARSEISIACYAILNSGEYGDITDDDRETLVRQVLDECAGSDRFSRCWTTPR